MKHEPCRFLLHTNLFGDLHGRDALAGRDEQVHRIEPLVERDVRPLEDRASTDRKVKLALIAAVEASLTGRDAVLTGAGWADDAFRPEARLQVEPRCLLIGEHLEELKGTDGRTAHCRKLSAGFRTGPWWVAASRTLGPSECRVAGLQGHFMFGGLRTAPGCQARRTAYPRKARRRLEGEKRCQTAARLGIHIGLFRGESDAESLNVDRLREIVEKPVELLDVDSPAKHVDLIALYRYRVQSANVVVYVGLAGEPADALMKAQTRGNQVVVEWTAYGLGPRLSCVGVSHFEAPLRLATSDVFKVVDSRTNVKKKMRQSCEQGSKRHNSL